MFNVVEQAICQMIESGRDPGNIEDRRRNPVQTGSVAAMTAQAIVPNPQCIVRILETVHRLVERAVDKGCLCGIEEASMASVTIDQSSKHALLPPTRPLKALSDSELQRDSHHTVLENMVCSAAALAKSWAQSDAIWYLILSLTCLLKVKFTEVAKYLRWTIRGITISQ